MLTLQRKDSRLDELSNEEVEERGRRERGVDGKGTRLYYSRGRYDDEMIWKDLTGRCWLAAPLCESAV